jgi:hypothetical protein
MGLGQRMGSPTAMASATTIAIAAKTRMTFRQFGSLGSGRGLVRGSSIQSNGQAMRREYPPPGCGILRSLNEAGHADLEEFLGCVGVTLVFSSARCRTSSEIRRSLRFFTSASLNGPSVKPSAHPFLRYLREVMELGGAA